MDSAHADTVIHAIKSSFDQSRQMDIFQHIYCYGLRGPSHPPLDVSYARWSAICKFFENNLND